MTDKDNKKGGEKSGFCAMAECFPKGEDGLPEQLTEEELVRIRFEQRLNTDPAFRDRVAAGYEEAKSGKDRRYSLDELMKLLAEE